jgi:hypothetical protein
MLDHVKLQDILEAQLFLDDDQKEYIDIDLESGPEQWYLCDVITWMREHLTIEGQDIIDAAFKWARNQQTDEFVTSSAALLDAIEAHDYFKKDGE